MSRPSRLLVIVALVLQAAAARAQVPALDLSDPAVSAAVPHDQEVTLMLANRPILVLRGRVLTRMPSDRAATASQVLDRLVSRGVTGPVESRPMSGATVITVGGEAVLAVLPADVDVLANDTMENTVATAIGRLRTALVEAKQ